MLNLKNLLKIVIPIVVFSFLGWQVIIDWPQVAGYFQKIKLQYLIISIPVFLLIYPEGVVCWWAILKKMKIKIPFSAAAKIWIISNASRYIPGKIWQYVGRVELSKKEAGIERSETLFSLLLEIFLTIIAAGLVSILALPVIGLQSLNKSFFIFLLPALLIMLHPKVANIVISIIAKLSKNRIKFAYPLNFADSISIFPLYILNFLLNGLALYLLVISVNGGGISINNLLIISGFYAFSWVVGFLSFFSPGGIGVTEITLAYLLSFLIPLSLASSVAILYRFMLTISELLIFVYVLKTPKKIGGVHINGRKY